MVRVRVRGAVLVPEEQELLGAEEAERVLDAHRVKRGGEVPG